MWVDFVDWRKREIVGIRTMHKSDGEGVEEQPFIDMLASPNRRLVESFIIMSVVEDLVKSNSLLQVFSIEDGEDLTTLEKLAVLIVLDELVDDFRFLD